jgi:protein gp37
VKTSIEWSEHSINPIRLRSSNGKRGHYCEKLSTGCKNCYSSRFQPRFGLPQFQEQRGNTSGLFLDASKLNEVLRRRKPTKYFWCDMTDMFGDWVPFEWIAACFGVMAATPQHVHQVLTKRPARALEFFRWIDECQRRNAHAGTGDTLPEHVRGFAIDVGKFRLPDGSMPPGPGRKLLGYDTQPWPLRSVHLGVSCENQETADKRLPLLVQCPAAVRWVSAEPLLGPVDLRWCGTEPKCGEGCADMLSPKAHGDPAPHLNWVVAGSESGHGARPMQIEWIESLRDQCRDAGVPFFTKQIANERDRKGGNPEFWPGGPWPREFPAVQS